MTGSCSWHARQAVATAAELVESGKAAVTKLGYLLIQKVASYGPECFIVDRKLAETIRQNNGRAPHPGSVARVRRALAAQQVLICRRVYAGQSISPKRGTWVSSHGCVRSRLNNRLGFTVADRRPSPPPATVATPRPRHGSVNALQTSPPVARPLGDYDEFARMAERAVAAAERRELAKQAAADEAMLATVPRSRGHPP